MLMRESVEESKSTNSQKINQALLSMVTMLTIMCQSLCPLQYFWGSQILCRLSKSPSDETMNRSLPHTKDCTCMLKVLWSMP